jgi:CRISPR-associated protein Csm4
MPKFKVMYLRPRGAFLLGRRGVGQEGTACFAPADTLFAALLATWVDWGRNAEEWMAGFPRSDAWTGPQNGKKDGPPPFLLTSAFPFAGVVRFYPRPRLRVIDVGQRGKALKRVQFISEELFRRAVAGRPFNEWSPGNQGGDNGPAVTLQGGAMWLAREEVSRLPQWLREMHAGGRARPLRALREIAVYDTSRTPRVTVDRMRQSSTIYHTGRLTFAPECGLWLGVQWNQAGDRQAAFETLLATLGDRGLGGERSAGYGTFYAKAGEEVAWPDPAPEQAFVTLSRYHPTPAELPAALTGRQAAYELEAVGGWVYSPGQAAQRRRRLWLVAEGSVCHAVGPGPWGDVVDVRPIYETISFAHPVWRYGLACPVALGGTT